MANKDELLESNYDGIQEYDNDLPRWWIMLFIGGIIFGFIYVGLYHIGSWQFASERLTAELADIESKRVAAEAAKPKPKDAKGDLLKLVSNSDALAAGKKLYLEKCTACHLEQGQGLVGPNLADDYWIHGGEITDIKRILVEGVLDKGMIAWGPLMSDEEINQVTAFVWSLKGTNPPNPKAPQGELYVPDGATPAVVEEAVNEEAAPQEAAAG